MMDLKRFAFCIFIYAKAQIKTHIVRMNLYICAVILNYSIDAILWMI